MIRMAVTVEPGRLELDKRLLRTTMRAAGAEVAATARALIRAGIKSRISTPGQPPISRTGVLARSIVVRPFKSGEGVSIRDTAFYALFLENGARGGVGSGKKGVKGKRNKRGRVVGIRILKPHPFLSTALEQREASIAQRVAASINQGMKFQRIRARP